MNFKQFTESKIVWKSANERGIKKLETPDGLYRIQIGFAGLWKGHTGKHKELGWLISKRNKYGAYEDSPVTYGSLQKAKQAAQERADAYGYDGISYTAAEYNKMKSS